MPALLAFGVLSAQRLADNAQEPSWAHDAFTAVAIAVGLAALLWLTGKRPLRGAAIALVVGAVLVGVVTVVEQERVHREADRWAGFVELTYEPTGPRLTRSEADAVPTGLTRPELRALLGPAAGHGIQRLYKEPDMRCLEYRIEGRADPSPPHRAYAFCFRDGRYNALREW